MADSKKHYQNVDFCWVEIQIKESAISKTKVLSNPCEQAKFTKGFTTGKSRRYVMRIALFTDPCLMQHKNHIF